MSVRYLGKRLPALADTEQSAAFVLLTTYNKSIMFAKLETKP
jgi:hypothetical protein